MNQTNPKMINSKKEWAFMDDINKPPAPLISKIKFCQTTYPPKPYLTYNQWVKFINKQVVKKYK